jgi:hypothetical protein
MIVTSRESRVARGASLALVLLTVSAYPPIRLSAQSIADKVKGLTKFDGFVPLLLGRGNGQALFRGHAGPGDDLRRLAARRPGSNDIGLDRGQLSGERIVRFDSGRSQGAAHPAQPPLTGP